MTDMVDPATLELEEEAIDAELQEILETQFANLDLPGFDVAIESAPQRAIRAKGRKEKVVAWEEYLSFLKSRPGATIRLFNYDGNDEGKKAASQRARSMRKRLLDTQPNEIWDIASEYVKESDSYKIFATYQRPATDEEFEQREKIRLDAIARGQNAAAARKAQREEKDAPVAKSTKAKAK